MAPTPASLFLPGPWPLQSQTSGNAWLGAERGARARCGTSPEKRCVETSTPLVLHKFLAASPGSLPAKMASGRSTREGTRKAA